MRPIDQSIKDWSGFGQVRGFFEDIPNREFGIGARPLRLSL